MINGKCPHKGIDLSNIEAEDGVITCPLHGLRFSEETKEIIWNTNSQMG
jgi:nitrite reductase/ring-hydroxylating ferredoxin subunit